MNKTSPKGGEKYAESSLRSHGKNAQNEILRRKFVLDFLSSHEHVTNADVCASLGVSSATANRILSGLCRDGTLLRVRVGKTWKYTLR